MHVVVARSALVSRLIPALLILLLGCIPPASTNDEFALLVLANRARVEASPALLPLRWHTAAAGAQEPGGLAAAARFHTDDMAENGCSGHNSCDGTFWATRITRYYPDWQALAENLVLGPGGPYVIHASWMASASHRATILSPSYLDYGAGITEGFDEFGRPLTFATADFGFRALTPVGAQPILAAAVIPRVGTATERELLLSFYAASPPIAVRALVGTGCVPLELLAGVASNGTYGTVHPFPSPACVRVAFEVVRADGTQYRWPETGAVLAGLDCAERAANAPQQDCGGG